MFTLLGLGAALVIALVAVGGLICPLALAQERRKTKIQRQDAGDFEARITQERRYLPQSR
jgi:hypothetical protein